MKTFDKIYGSTMNSPSGDIHILSMIMAVLLTLFSPKLVFPQLIFDGLQNTPLGQAALQQDANGHLVVSNIGSSGDDGVSIDLGEAESGRLSYLPIPAMPQDAFLNFKAFGSINSVVDQLISSITFTGVNGTDDYRINFDFSSLNPSSQLIQIFDADQLVFEGPFLPGADYIVQNPQCDVVLPYSQKGPTFAEAIVQYQQVTPILIPGEPPVNGDRIVYSALNPLAQVDFMSALDICAADVGQFIIPDEALSIFCLPNRAAGQALLDAQGGNLIVSNIGSSGLDGVSIDLPPSGVRGFEAEFQPLALLGFQPIIVNTMGTPTIWDATVTLAENNGNFDALANFNIPGINNINVMIFDQGVLQGGFIVPNNGLAGTLLIPPFGPPVTVIRSGGFFPENDPLGIRVELNAPFPFTDPLNQFQFIGNELVFVPQELQPPLPFPVFFKVFGSNLNDLIILNETFVQPPLIFESSPQVPLGQAHLSQDPSGNLIVSNIGSSGEDGVRVDPLPPNTSSFENTFTGLELAGPGPLGIQLIGQDDLNNQFICDINGGNDLFNFTVDFSALGVTQLQVDVFDQGIFVGTEILPNGLLGTLAPPGLDPLGIQGSGFLLPPSPIPIPPDPGLLGFQLMTQGVVLSTSIPKSRADLIGDEIHVTAVDPQSSAGSLSSFTTLASGISQIVMTGQNLNNLNFVKSIQSGWNMVSLPFLTVDRSYQSVFSDANINTFFGYNGSYFAEDSFEICNGYWLNFSAQSSAVISGHQIDSCTINLLQGWNMIGGISGDIALADVSDPGGIINPGTLFGFAGSYFSTDTIKQGEGYWINATAAGPIILNLNTGSTTPLDKRMEKSLNLSQFSSLEIKDAAGHRQKLYFNVMLDRAKNKIHYVLPPISPNGTFDARFAGDYRISEQDEALIQVQAPQYPLSIEVANLPLETGYSYALTEMGGKAELQTHILHEGKMVEIINPGVTKLRLSKMVSNLPTEFRVHQNYPNPFNPSTTINYDLPERGNVKIVIYNSLGQLVRTLVDKTVAAGFREVVWNGKNDRGNIVSSGIFFYQIVAGDLIQTRKMVLLK